MVIIFSQPQEQMSLTKRAVAAGIGGATPTSSRAVSLSQKKRGIAAGEHHAKGTDAKVSQSRRGIAQII